ncbi:uncharacterized protein LOC123526641 [Mercenaria mercenaria]|uniref:uncharacterized protein LOC123526641 n=1 Tax=Mercenaria mercenaria TaxID=6596 RepID=UPI00234E594E|nr:uncharacterized protein LOC123526641 [Mercenaria mercenaria]
MNFVLILLLQTLGAVFGGHILLDRSSTVNKFNRKNNRINFKERSNIREVNDSDGDGYNEINGNTDEKWVVDSIFYEDYQSDSPANNIASLDVCPPVPDVITDDACAQSSCQKDTDCSDGFRCCFTGCSFSCLPEIKPAALVDWRKEPRRSRSGISWLISEPRAVKSSSEAEACSTSPVESDEDPLLCPHGYFCHVTDPGSPKEGIPNSGYCVKHTGEKYSLGEEELVIASALSERKTCKVDNIVLLNGANIELGNKNCRCKKGYLSCKKRLRKTRVKKKTKGVKNKTKPRATNKKNKRGKGKNKRL